MSTHALVVGSSGGLGSAVAEALRARRDPSTVLTVSRREDGFDLTRPGSVDALAERLRADGVTLDLVFVATGVLTAGEARPERSLAEIDAGVMTDIFRANALGPALVLGRLGPLLPRTGPCHVGVLSARVGSIGDNGLGGWMSYRASKAALNQVVRCAAIELRRRNPASVVLALHPGTIETDLTRAHARGRYTATAAVAAAQLLDVLTRTPPEDSGSFKAYDGSDIPW